MKQLLLIALIILLPTQAYSALKEKDYQDYWCKGIVEYRLDNGTRVDCLTDTHAYEVDYARKFYEAIGQSLYYAIQTDRRAGIVLIIKDSNKEFKYLLRLFEVIKTYNLDITIDLVFKEELE